MPKKGSKNTSPRLFGTDGIRAVAGLGPLAPGSVALLGRALGAFLSDHAKKGRRPRVLVGVDPRPSADMVALALASGLIAQSCDVHWPGMMSTPEVAFLTGKGFDAGVSVTIAFTFGFTRSICPMKARITSVTESFRAWMSRASFFAGWKQRSVMVT